MRKAADRTGVHRNTAFRWRHRFLDWVKLDRPPRRRGGCAALRGISRHLDCILVARDRSGNTIDAVTGRGALTAAQLERDLLPRLDPQALLVTDSHAADRAFSRKHGTAHQAVSLHSEGRTKYLGSRWTLDGGRVCTPEQMFRIAVGVINR